MTERDLKREKFHGFVAVRRLSGQSLENVPEQCGVYAVLRTRTGKPSFRSINPGGWFKSKDPTVRIRRLRDRWVPSTQVLYFGKGNGLRKRIRDLIRFSEGRPVGHWGGRLLWQVAGSQDFLVAWKSTPGREPFDVEGELMEWFRRRFGCLPFANIQGPRRAPKRTVGAGRSTP